MTYPKTALAKHPGLNDQHQRWGRHGQCHARYNLTRPNGRTVEVISVFDASRWLAHTGQKERRRHAGRPNGLMHRETPGLRSNDFKRATTVTTGDFTTAKVAKPRKPRAKKAAAAA